jgi:hypothetical protein
VDPVTFIVSAVALGAASGLSESAKTAVTDTFGAFVRLIRERYARAGLEPVLDHPESEHKKGSLEEDLREAGAADDAELLAAARAVVEDDRIQQAAAQVVAVDLREIKAQALTIVDVAHFQGESGQPALAVRGMRRCSTAWTISGTTPSTSGWGSGTRWPGGGARTATRLGPRPR